MVSPPRTHLSIPRTLDRSLNQGAFGPSEEVARLKPYGAFPPYQFVGTVRGAEMLRGSDPP